MLVSFVRVIGSPMVNIMNVKYAVTSKVRFCKNDSVNSTRGSKSRRLLVENEGVST